MVVLEKLNFSEGKVRGLHKTDIEEIMEISLRNAGIPFVSQFPIRCKYGYILDVAIPEQKICVECDGSFWHKKRESTDKKRNAFLKKAGWRILRFTDKEIKADVSQCIFRIQQELKGGENGENQSQSQGKSSSADE